MIVNRIFVFFIIINISLFLYTYQIQITNEYLGMMWFEIDFIYLIILFDSVIFIVIYLYLLEKKSFPIKIINHIFIVLVIIWSFVFYKLTNLMSYELYLLLVLVTFIPLFMISFFSSFIKQIIKVFFININFLYFLSLKYVLTLLLLVIAIIISFKMPLSFSFEESYIRRIAGRELITDLSAYLLAMGMNSIAPFLSFYSFLYKKYIYFIFSLVFVILCFGFIGTKAPIFYVLLLSFFGFVFERYKRINILNIFIRIILCIFLIAIVEYLINGFSIIADIVIRRAFVVVAQNQTYFIDFMINNFTFENWLLGYDSVKPITFIIGEIYYNNTNTNANTNAFVYELASNGLLGYLGLIVFLTFFFSFLSFIYVKYQLKEVIGIAIIYSLLLTEQAYTTAFVTSGVSLITFLTLLTIKYKRL